MKLHCHQGKGEDNNLEQKEVLIREHVIAEDKIKHAPQHCRNEERDEKRMPLLPRTAARRRYNQRYISYSCYKREYRVYVHYMTNYYPKRNACQVKLKHDIQGRGY